MPLVLIVRSDQCGTRPVEQTVSMALHGVCMRRVPYLPALPRTVIDAMG